MTVCAHRTDEPSFFTPCVSVCNGTCPCGEEVRAEAIDQAVYA